MNLSALWCSDATKSRGLPTPQKKLESVELQAKIVQEAFQIEQFCTTLINTKARLFTRADLDEDVEPIFMVGVSDKDVVLEIPPPYANEMMHEKAVDLITTAPGGTALFTLPNFRMTANRVARADRPELVIRMQSREHYRTLGKLGARQLVQLIVPGTSNPLVIQDLSETGLCFDKTQPAPAKVQTILQAVLVLEDTSLTIPALTIIRETRVHHCLWRCGAAMQGLQENDLRMIRRWTQQVETNPSGTRGR